jgi:DNA-binding SARP family transcriptional activator/tetratricopeptide (TPR) repeat protein
VEYRILGPLEVIDGGQRLRLGGVKQRAVLAILLLNANRVVSVDRLVDDLWEGRPPGSAIGTLQTYVSHLRDLLEPRRDRRTAAQVLVTRSPGYLLRVGADDLDALRLERLVVQGQQALAARHAPVAAARFRVALELWRGPALADFADQPFATTEIDRLEQLRLVAVEGRVKAELAMGNHAELVGQLEALVAEHPFREGFREQLMLALYRSGRQAEALGVFRTTRELLAGELGIDPDNRLARLQQAVLRHAPELDWRPDQEQQGPQPTAPAPPSQRPHRPPGPGNVLVGREPEMAELRAALAELHAGRGRLFLVAGEPGIGKTRLARELTEEAQADGLQVLWGRAWEEDGAPSFWPWVQIARAWMAERTVEQLSSGLAADAAIIAQLIPELAQRLPGLPEPAGLEPALARFRLFDAVTGWLRRAAAEQPIVVVLDDLHRADTPSLLLLRFLARELGSAQLLVLGTYRHAQSADQSFAKTLAELAREPVARRIRLEGLYPPEVARFVELASGKPVPSALLQGICERTSGNPFFVRELVQLLQHKGRLDHAEQMTDPIDDIPSSVQEVVRGRVGDLSDAAGDILAGASVLGREFDLATLALICDVADDRLLELVEEAQAAGFLTEAPGRLGRYRFSHILVRDALYGQLRGRRHAQLHERAGEALESVYGSAPGARLPELAHHFLHASRETAEGKGLSYTIQAAEYAMGVLAYEDAVTLFETALRLPVDPTRRCQLLLALADAQMKAGATAQGRATLLQAAETAKALGAPGLFARAALGFGTAFEFVLVDRAVVQQFTELVEAALGMLGPEDAPLRALLLSRLAMAFILTPPERQGDAWERRTALSAEAVAMARRLGDDSVLAPVLYARGLAAWGPDNLKERTALSTELLQLSTTLGDQELTLAARQWHIVSCLEAGDIATVDQDLRAFTRQARQLRQPLYLYWSAILQSTRALLRGQFDEAERLSLEALTMGQRLEGRQLGNIQNGVGAQLQFIRREQGRMSEVEPMVAAFVERLPQIPAWRMALAMIDASIGQLETARVQLDFLARDGFGRIPRDVFWLPALAGLAEVCATLGDEARAAQLYDLLVPYRQRFVVIGFGFACMGAVAQFLGQLASVTHRWEDAGRHFEAALQSYVRVGARPALARTGYEYAQMLLDRNWPGDRQRALELLTQATETAEELGMPWLHDKALAASQAGK